MLFAQFFKKKGGGAQNVYYMAKLSNTASDEKDRNKKTINGIPSSTPQIKRYVLKYNYIWAGLAYLASYCTKKT